MTLSRNPLVIAATLAATVAATVAAGLVAGATRLHAVSQDQPVPHLDDDGDGVDNGLECRIGSKFDDANVDGDECNDLMELVYGTDPNTPYQPGEVPAATRGVVLETYASPTHFYIQVYAHHTETVDSAVFHVAREHADPDQQYFTLQASALAPYLSRIRELPAHDPAFKVTSARFKIPLGALAGLGPNFAIAVELQLDGFYEVADGVRYTNSAFGLMEIREIVLQGGGGGAGGTGGLFPADPNLSPPPDEATFNEVCVQELSVSGSLGTGGVLYTVADAYCDSLLQANCPSTCVDSTGDSVVGIDIASLIN